MKDLQAGFTRIRSAFVLEEIMDTYDTASLMSELYFQAHRGTVEEGKENTLAAFVHAWQFPQAIVETDIRQLADGNLICLHDRTIRRVCSTFSPLIDTPVDTLTWQDLEHIDLGKGHHIPLFQSVLELMAAEKQLRLYLEVKEADLSSVLNMLKAYNVTDRMLFVHESQDFLQEVHALLPDNEKMTWCSGTVEQIMHRFDTLHRTRFEGITQVQIHYPVNQEPSLSEKFLDHALFTTRAAGVTLQVCPQGVTVEVLRYLIKKGVRWFVTNAPRSFVTMIEQALSS